MSESASVGAGDYRFDNKPKEKKSLGAWRKKEVSLPDLGNPLLISAKGLAARAYPLQLANGTEPPAELELHYGYCIVGARF